MYRNELDNACYTPDATCANSKYLAEKIWKIEHMKLL